MYIFGFAAYCDKVGTEVLRRGLNPKEASKAFVLDMADNRTIDLVNPEPVP